MLRLALRDKRRLRAGRVVPVEARIDEIGVGVRGVCDGEELDIGVCDAGVGAVYEVAEVYEEVCVPDCGTDEIR